MSEAKKKPGSTKRAKQFLQDRFEDAYGYTPDNDTLLFENAYGYIPDLDDEGDIAMLLIEEYDEDTDQYVNWLDQPPEGDASGDEAEELPF